MFERWKSGIYMRVKRDSRGRFATGSRIRLSEGEARKEVRDYFKDLGMHVIVPMSTKIRTSVPPIYIPYNKADVLLHKMMSERKNRESSGTIEVIEQDYGWTYQYEGKRLIYVSKFGAYFGAGPIRSLQAYFVASILIRMGAKDEGYSLFYTPSGGIMT